VMLDPVRVEDRATFAKPHQYSQGFDTVLVNGAIEVEDGKLTDARSGRTVRHRP